MSLRLVANDAEEYRSLEKALERFAGTSMASTSLSFGGIIQRAHFGWGSCRALWERHDMSLSLGSHRVCSRSLWSFLLESLSCLERIGMFNKLANLSRRLSHMSVPVSLSRATCQGSDERAAQTVIEKEGETS